MVDKTAGAIVFFTWLFGWVYWLFTEHPKMFFIGLLVGIILIYLIYRLFLKGSMKAIKNSLKSFTPGHHGGSDQLAATRVQLDDLDKIAGLDPQLEEIYKQIELPRSLNENVRNDLGIRNVRGVILYGPPGTGKTMLARNLAKKLGCKSVEKASAVSLIDKYYGSSEENLRELFVHDPGTLHMVILDEIDSICPARTTGMNDSRFYTALTNQLLSLLDGIDADPDVIVVGTTNRLDTIDPAMLRPGRFDIHLEIKMPDDDAREKILRVYTETLIEKELMEKYDIENMVERTKGLTGAGIENMVRKATTTALYRHKLEGEPLLITEADLIEAI